MYTLNLPPENLFHKMDQTGQGHCSCIWRPRYKSKWGQQVELVNSNHMYFSEYVSSWSASPDNNFGRVKSKDWKATLWTQSMV